MADTHSIRIPIHGFLEISSWERDIINHTVFQRLRRIRQLAFSEHLYPGSVHSRFEHSLGVMHVATRLYDALSRKHEALLADRLQYNPGNSRARTLVRLAALLHDVGHAPFSHTGEDLMPTHNGRQLRHEDYSAELIRNEMKDVIDDHAANKREHNVSGDEVANFYLGKPAIGSELLFWKELVSGQLDADRMDYLLRDSFHCGVAYGQFDLERLVDTILIVEDISDESATGLRIGIEQGGQHAAEGLILARYFMFTQVYFHHVRKAFDHHASESLKSLLSSDTHQLPDPKTEDGRKAFLALDDWTVGNFIKEGGAGRHGTAILAHSHDRRVSETPEVPSVSDLEGFDAQHKKLLEADLDAWIGDAENEWYKVNHTEVRIANAPGNSLSAPTATPLSEVSDVVGKIEESKKRMLFVPEHDANRAKQLIKE